MKLLSFGCTNYKPFKVESIIELAPLTLIFGKNSSGKSAMLRLLPLILRALAPQGSAAFPLQVGSVSYGKSFADLVHGKLPHGSVDFHIKLESEGEIFDLTSTVQNVSGNNIENYSFFKSSKVSHFILREPVPIELNWQPSNDANISYVGVGEISFRGLLPEARGGLGGTEWLALTMWRDRIQQFERSVAYLGPYRSSIKKVYESAQSEPIGFGGEGAPGYLSNSADLLERVGAWYQQHMDGWRLTISPGGNYFECNLLRGNTTVNMADVGQGMQQVLPIVVQQLAHQLSNEEQFIDLIEQPELHLHTAAQAPLGDLFLDTAKLRTGQLIVETHSENILLRIRRRIAEGADPALVALYWVEDHPDGTSTIRRIHIDQSGNLDWWQEGVFSEGYEEVKAMNRAARAHRNGQES